MALQLLGFSTHTSGLIAGESTTAEAKTQRSFFNCQTDQQNARQSPQWAVDRSGDALTVLGYRLGVMALHAFIFFLTSMETFLTLPVVRQCMEY
jgi:hypothetical protein